MPNDISVLRMGSALLFGLLAGSAATAFAEDGSIRSWLTRARSRCARCGRTLNARDLVPVLSFLLLRGRCRFCGKPIPWWHVGIELAAVGGFLILGVFSAGRHTFDLATLVLAFVILLFLSAVDSRQMTLPDALVLALAVVGLSRVTFLGSPSVASALVGGAVGLLVLGLLAFVPWEPRRSKRSFAFVRDRRSRTDVAGGRRSGAAPHFSSAMGLGDVKLAGAMGLTLGFPGLLVALFLAFLFGGAVGGLLIATRRATFKSRMPFGPFLAGATAVLLLWPALPEILFRLSGLAYT